MKKKDLESDEMFGRREEKGHSGNTVRFRGFCKQSAREESGECSLTLRASKSKKKKRKSVRIATDRYIRQYRVAKRKRRGALNGLARLDVKGRDRSTILKKEALRKPWSIGEKRARGEEGRSYRRRGSARWG